VHSSNLNILMDHQSVGEDGASMMGTIINSKGFGGNNASALLLSPAKTLELMATRHGAPAMTRYRVANEAVLEEQRSVDKAVRSNGLQAIYSFGESVMGADQVDLSPDAIKLAQFENPIHLSSNNPFID